MAGSGYLLPEHMEEEVRAELDIFNRQHKPQNAYEQRLVETAALAQVRKNRLHTVELAADESRVRNAFRQWDERRSAEVATLADALADDPAAALEGLRRTADGCDWLFDRWRELGIDLERFGHWDEDRARQALRLLGLSAPPNPQRSPDLHRVWRHAHVLLLHAQAANPAGKPSQPVPAHLPTRDVALAVVLDFVFDTLDELRARGNALWEEYDRPDRAAAPKRALFDPGPEGRLWFRYYVEAERMRRRALTELESLRRADVRARRGSLEPEPTLAPHIDPTPPPPAATRSEPEPLAAPPPSSRSEPEPAAPPTPATPPAASSLTRSEPDDHGNRPSEPSAATRPAPPHTAPNPSDALAPSPPA